MAIMLLASIPAYADEGYRGDFFIKNFNINGEKIVNYNLQYSIVTCDDVMYIPLTPEMCEIYGVEADMDWESNTLTLSKTDPVKKNISDNWIKNNLQALSLNEIPGAKAVTLIQGEPDYIYDRVDEAETPPPTVEDIDLKGAPILEKDKIIYVPLRAIAESDVFGWDIYYSNYYGVCISTDGDTPAKTYFDSGEALENKGLVNYMMNYNGSITPSYGQQLVFLFKRAGDVYGVDPKLLMAIAHKESTFNTGSVSRSGATGMMQVMPATGARYNLTEEQLKDPKIAIDFAAMYMSERIAAYNGDWNLALSAYNQGSRSVNRGTNSNVYANNVMSAYSGICNFLEVNGYKM